MRIISPRLKMLVYPMLSSIGAFHRISQGWLLSLITNHSAHHKSVDAAFYAQLEGLRNGSRISEFLHRGT
jgi:hypothetical protein